MAAFESHAARAATGLALAGLLAACAPASGERDADGPDGVLADLAGADGMTIHALFPYEHEYMEGGEHADEAETVPRFHGQPVLGTATVDDAATRDQLLALVERGIESSDGTVAACFDPRHGFSVEKDGVVTDLLVCYACLSMEVFVDGERADGHLTVEAVEPRITEIFEDLGLEIAE